MLDSSGATETSRLLLVPWSDTYSDDFARLCADPAAMRFITGGEPLPPQAASEISARSRALWVEYGFGPWAALERSSGRWVGRIGLNLLADWPGPDPWEVSFELATPFWNLGLATEGARRTIEFAWEETSLNRIISVTAPAHAASRRVMEKCGMSFQGELAWRDTTVVWYAIDRD